MKVRVRTNGNELDLPDALARYFIDHGWADEIPGQEPERTTPPVGRYHRRDLRAEH